MCTDYEGPAPEQKAEMKRKTRQEMFGFVPRARVRPTDPAPIIVPIEDRLECREMRWGWSKWDKSVLVNAKSETVTELKTFKPHLGNRCLIPARTFTEGGAKFHRPDRTVFFMAGLWRTEDGIQRFVLMTTTPNESVAPYHGRMPFLLRYDQLGDWLGDKWEQALADPDKSPLEKFEKQPRLF